MTEKVIMKTGIKIFFLGFVALSLFISIYIAVEKNDFNTERICALILVLLLCSACIVYTLYLLLYRAIVHEDYFEVRRFFKTRVYKLADITNIEYKRIAFGDYAYILKFGKRKMEVSQLMKNKIAIDRKLDEQGLFKKFPKVKI